MSGRDLPRFALRLLACGLAALLGPAGCGGRAQPQDPMLRGERLTIYSSLPQHGPEAPVADDVLRAQQLALAQHGGRIGDYRVRLVALDAATPKSIGSEPSQMSENARLAARDPTTVAYLGELGSGASAISIPLLNEAGILQVSPLDGAIALTTGSVAVTGSPERFYPKAKETGRTFARVVPSDRSQADALLAYMRAQGVRRLALLTDDDVGGLALATRVRARAHRARVAVVAREQVDVHAREHEELVERVVLARPDAVLDATGAREGTPRLWRELLAADASLELFGPANLVNASFARALGSAGPAARLTRPVLGVADDTPAARRFERAFERRWGRLPEPEARYGYEAMRGVLAAIERALRDAPGSRVTRAGVVDAYFRTQVRESVLGPYTIARTGDSTLVRWGAFRVAGGELRYVRPLAGASAER